MINLDSLKYLYEYLKEEEELYKITEDKEEEEITFEDLKDYVINTIISNIEYDFDVDFYNYVDMNNFMKDFIKESE